VIAAFDIGGTHVAAARVDLETVSVVAESRRRTPLPAGAPRHELVRRLVETARAVTSPEVERSGVAVPGPFDYERGVCRVRHKLVGLYGVSLRHELAIGLGLRGFAVSFLNDAAAFLLGESLAGAARGHARAVGITLGTGLGSAFLADGLIVESGQGVPPGGVVYLLPFRGDPVEDRISRRALLSRYGDTEIDVEQVADRARDGDERATAAFREVGADLAEFLAPWLESFEADCLVVGGSIARAWDLFEPVLRPGLASVRSLDLVTAAALIDDAALLGAALHAAGRDGP
jgi:glucokinase